MMWFSYYTGVAKDWTVFAGWNNQCSVVISVRCGNLYGIQGGSCFCFHFMRFFFRDSMSTANHQY